jgi:multidrug resistance protein, MATE family
VTMEGTPSAPRKSSRSSGLDAPLVSGSLWKSIWHMSWPLVITTSAASVVGLVDMYVAGYLGSAAQATVGVAEQVLFLFMVLLMSLGVGTTAIVSRAYGAGKIEEANTACAQSLVLACSAGLVLAVVSLLAGRFVLPLITHVQEIVTQGTLYLGVIGLYLAPFGVVCVANAAFRGIGDARTPLVIVCTEVVINIAGDFLTVLGNWPVPGLGVRGIAVSGIAGSCAAGLLAIWFVSRSPLAGSLKRLLPATVSMMRRVVGIGLPSALQRLSWAASGFVVFAILSRCQEPTSALASWSVGIRVEALLFMPLIALSLAVGAIVGQNLGAGEVARARRAGWHMAGMGMGLMLVLGVLMFIFARALATLMSHDASTIAYTTSYLCINAVAEPALAINMILSGALQGAGDTRTPMWVSVFCSWGVRLPLAWCLALVCGFGPVGVWSAMFVSMVTSAILMSSYYARGTWVKTVV